MSDILAIVAIIMLIGALAAVVYNHKAITADVEKLDAVAGRVDTALVAPAVEAAKPVVVEASKSLIAETAQAAALVPGAVVAVSADVAGSQPKAQ